jgi:hypothetical protein
MREGGDACRLRRLLHLPRHASTRATLPAEDRERAIRPTSDEGALGRRLSMSPSRRAAIVIVIAALAAAAARMAAPSEAKHVRFSVPLACGVERWKVKTLQDRPRLLPAKATTVAHLTGLTRPSSLPQTRLPLERQIYSLIAAVTLVRSEADQDFPVVLQSGTKTMIAESPTVPTCTVSATPYRRRQMADARNAVRLVFTRARGRRRLLGFQARPNRRGAQCDRTAPNPRLRVHLWLRAERKSNRPVGVVFSGEAGRRSED